MHLAFLKQLALLQILEFQRLIYLVRHLIVALLKFRILVHFEITRLATKVKNYVWNRNKDYLYNVTIVQKDPL